MQHATQAQFGRPMMAVQNPAIDETDLVDKWDILKTLSDAAEDYGLSHRTLSVLKVLMTFLPGRMINPQHRSAVVFPSNKTLAERLNGMPDSTLRRHLAHLVASGIVSRHDSANRKRFARYAAQGVRHAFGFDLSPLARRHAEISNYATTRNQEREALQALRAELAQLRQQLLFAQGEGPLTITTQKILRRQPNRTDLEAAISDIKEEFTASLSSDETVEMNATNDQNERHIEDESINYSVCKSSLREKKPNPLPYANDAPKDLLRRLKAYKEYFPEPINHWNDVICIADRLTHMMGIDSGVFKEAMEQMGQRSAAIAVLSILERFSDIENHGGYLRRLTQAARAGRLNLNSLVK